MAKKNKNITKKEELVEDSKLEVLENKETLTNDALEETNEVEEDVVEAVSIEEEIIEVAEEVSTNEVISEEVIEKESNTEVVENKLQEEVKKKRGTWERMFGYIWNGQNYD